MSDGQRITEAYDRLLTEAFRAFAIEYRKNSGRPLTAKEWSLAQVAHGFGFTHGVDAGVRALCEVEDETPDTQPVLDPHCAVCSTSTTERTEYSAEHGGQVHPGCREVQS
jgi:hypothetical protein